MKQGFPLGNPDLGKCRLVTHHVQRHNRSTTMTFKVFGDYDKNNRTPVVREGLWPCPTAFHAREIARELLAETEGGCTIMWSLDAQNQNMNTGIRCGVWNP